jgi:hypothetical protein
MNSCTALVIDQYQSNTFDLEKSEHVFPLLFSNWILTLDALSLTGQRCLLTKNTKVSHDESLSPQPRVSVTKIITHVNHMRNYNFTGQAMYSSAVFQVRLQFSSFCQKIIFQSSW